MMTAPSHFEVIFQSQNGKEGKWLDYCRERSPYATLQDSHAWAEYEAKQLAKRIGCNCRARVMDAW